jgi:hypothetical protein
MGGDKGAVAPPTLVDEMLTQAGPFAGQIGVGALAGACDTAARSWRERC